jgi:hypothetical protein
VVNVDRAKLFFEDPLPPIWIGRSRGKSICNAHPSDRRERADWHVAARARICAVTQSAVMRLAASLLLAAGTASALDWDGEIDLTKTTKEFMGLGGLSGGGGTTCVALDSRWAAAPAVRR